MDENNGETISNINSSESDEFERNACVKSKDPILAQKDPAFYTDAAAYWEKIPPTVNGVLGGFESISSTDIVGSESFIKSIFKMNNPPGHGRTVDCGAGIGRITKYLLQKHFGKTDLVEQCSIFLDKAKENFKDSKKIGEFYCIGLQNFMPLPNYYDVIWCQWVLGHLNDDDLHSFFQRLITGLKPNGVIVVKENLCETGLVELDEEDSSVTRPQSLWLHIFEKVGLTVVKNIQQRHLPKKLYEVRMFCLKPKSDMIVA